MSIVYPDSEANNPFNGQSVGNAEAIDFEANWKSLAESLRKIHTKEASVLSFEELYRNAYKLVLKKKGETLYYKVKDFEEEWLVQEIRPRILDASSPSLMLAATGVQTIITVNEKKAAGDKLLGALKEAWEDHNLCMNMTTDVLMYMVRDVVYSGVHPLNAHTSANRK